MQPYPRLKARRPTERPVCAQGTPTWSELRVPFIPSSIPRRCGIATFTADIMAAVKAADPTVRCSVIAIDEPNSARAYGSEVKARIRQREPESYRAAAALLNASNVDVVNLQHEFGLYGVWKDGGYEDHRRALL